MQYNRYGYVYPIAAVCQYDFCSLTRFLGYYAFNEAIQVKDIEFI
jgi:hypothetical protein